MKPKPSDKENDPSMSSRMARNNPIPSQIPTGSYLSIDSNPWLRSSCIHSQVDSSHCVRHKPSSHKGFHPATIATETAECILIMRAGWVRCRRSLSADSSLGTQSASFSHSASATGEGIRNYNGLGMVVDLLGILTRCHCKHLLGPRSGHPDASSGCTHLGPFRWAVGRIRKFECSYLNVLPCRHCNRFDRHIRRRAGRVGHRGAGWSRNGRNPRFHRLQPQSIRSTGLQAKHIVWSTTSGIRYRW